MTPPFHDRPLDPVARKAFEGIRDALGFTFLVAVLFGVLWMVGEW